MAAGSDVRAFVAIDLTDEVREKAGQISEKLAQTGHGVKWVKPGNMHLTLKFLGNVPQDLLETVGVALAGSTEGFGPMDLEVGGVGSFPPKGRPRVIWLGISGHTKRLGQLAMKMPRSIEILKSQAGATGAASRRLQQKEEFHNRWPEVEGFLSRAGRETTGDFRQMDRFLEGINRRIGTAGHQNYIEAIQGIDPDLKKSGTLWLQSIVDEVVDRVGEVMPLFAKNN